MPRSKLPMNPGLTDAGALILAGGRSSRMGRDKVLLPFADGQTLLQRAIGFWRELCPLVLIAAGSPDHLPRDLAEELHGVQLVYDAFPGCGPLAGLQAGLRASDRELLFVGAVDLPYPSAKAAWLLYEAIGRSDAAVFCLHDRREPLFGLYRRTCLPEAETMLEAGEYKMGLLLDRVETICLPAQEDRLFFNMNTPAEYVQALRDLDRE